MKKKISIGILLGILGLWVNALGQNSELVAPKNENNKSPTTYLSLLLNLVSTNLNYGESDGDLSGSKKSALGAQLGVSFQAGVTPGFSLVPELYFIMKGGRLESNELLNVRKTQLHLYTLELPVLARLHFRKAYFNTGPSIAYNLFGKQKIGDASSSLSFHDSPNGFKRWDLGLQVGAGYEFKIKSKRLALDIRYSYGLTNISYDQELFNRYLNISLILSKPWQTNPLERVKK